MISNVGATVLLVPLVVNLAIAANADPRMAALVVGLATSNSFILPTHQVNALYMGPGHYRSVDFMKAGALISVLFIVIMIGVIYLFYGVWPARPAPLEKGLNYVSDYYLIRRLDKRSAHC